MCREPQRCMGGADHDRRCGCRSRRQRTCTPPLPARCLPATALAPAAAVGGEPGGGAHACPCGQMSRRARGCSLLPQSPSCTLSLLCPLLRKTQVHRLPPRRAHAGASASTAHACGLAAATSGSATCRLRSSAHSCMCVLPQALRPAASHRIAACCPCAPAAPRCSPYGHC